MTRLPDNRLWLHRGLWKRVRAAGEAARIDSHDDTPLVDLEKETRDDWFRGLGCQHSDYTFQKAVVFDCRELPPEFVEESGLVVLDEQRDYPKLPFEVCYFEFANEFAVTATTVLEEGAVLDPERPSLAIQQFDGQTTAWRDETDLSWKEETDLYPDDDPKKQFYIEAVEEIGKGQRGAILVLGVLALLNEKLLADEIRPDPAPRLTASRSKDGRYPLTGPSHVLTVNVAAVRKATREVSIGKHESPCLHWRRGHNRVVHRGSEFEKRVWVSKCLVGDPSKGYLATAYKLTQHQPMIGTN